MAYNFYDALHAHNQGEYDKLTDLMAEVATKVLTVGHLENVKDYIDDSSPTFDFSASAEDDEVGIEFKIESISGTPLLDETIALQKAVGGASIDASRAGIMTKAMAYKLVSNTYTKAETIDEITSRVVRSHNWMQTVTLTTPFGIDANGKPQAPTGLPNPPDDEFTYLVKVYDKNGVGAVFQYIGTAWTFYSDEADFVTHDELSEALEDYPTFTDVGRFVEDNWADKAVLFDIDFEARGEDLYLIGTGIDEDGDEASMDVLVPNVTNSSSGAMTPAMKLDLEAANAHRVDNVVLATGNGPHGLKPATLTQYGLLKLEQLDIYEVAAIVHAPIAPNQQTITIPLPTDFFTTTGYFYDVSVFAGGDVSSRTVIIPTTTMLNSTSVTFTFQGGFKTPTTVELYAKVTRTQV